MYYKVCEYVCTNKWIHPIKKKTVYVALSRVICMYMYGIYVLCVWVFLSLSLPQDLVLTTFLLTLMVTVTGLFLMEQHVLTKMVSVNKILLAIH